MENNLSIIVFSKDRPLQLQGYLDSLLYFSEIKSECLSVLYKENLEISYEHIKKKFANINWVKENSFFDNLIDVINKSAEYIMFGCDDVIFKNDIDFTYATSILAKNQDIFGFSLRLGKNIKPTPSQIAANNLHIEWNWKNTKLDNWNYPWELDSTIYRKSDILKIFQKLNALIIKNPNFFESEIASNVNKYVEKEYLAAFTVSKSIVITVNRVQDSFKNEYDDSFDTDVKSLNVLYKEGAKINFLEISKLKNKKIHVGAEFFKITGSTEYTFSLVHKIKNVLKKFNTLLKRFR